MIDNVIIEKHFQRIKLVIKESFFFYFACKKNFSSLDAITILIYVWIQEKISHFYKF